LKWKQSKAPWVGMLGPSHWRHEICLTKRVGHHFWPGLIIIPLAKNTLLLPIQPIGWWGGSLDALVGWTKEDHQMKFHAN
jgi:hypothetical protein